MVSMAIETLGIMSCDQRLCRRTSSMCTLYVGLQVLPLIQTSDSQTDVPYKLLLDCNDAAKVVNAVIASCTGEMYH